MRLITLGILLSISLSGQTVQLRDSSPAAAPVCGASNTTPIVIQTCSPHGLSVGDFVTIQGVATGTGLSSVNGPKRKIITSGSNDTTHVAIGDSAGTAIPANGAWFDGTAAGSINAPGGPQWIAKVHDYTLPSGPIGWLDGTNGVHTRELALWTGNGLTSVIITLCPGACLATVTTSYSHGLVSGNKVGIWGSGSSALDNGHAGYTVTVTGSTTFTFPAPGTSNGTKTGVNNVCGPATVPNGTIGGTDDCFTVSQWAYVGNPAWDGIETALSITNMNTGTDYKNVFQGGKVISGFQAPGWYANAALKFAVDRSNVQMFAAAMYCFVWPELLSNVNWVGNELFGSAGNNFTSDFLSHNMNGFAMVYEIMAPYASAAVKTVTLNKIYNDSDDPSVTPCSSANGDVGTGHNDVLATGVSQNGTGSSITLASSDTQNDNYYVGNVVYLPPTTNGAAWGRITNYVKSTKIATVSVNDHWLPPTVGTPYSIYATITSSNQTASNITTGGATATIAGINTHFTTKVHIGDALEGENDWDSTPDSSSSYVCGGPGGCGTPITSDTSLTVINSWLPVTPLSTAASAWYFPAWSDATHDCGMVHRNKYWVGSPMSQPATYPSGGSLLAAVPGGPLSVRTLSTDGGNNTMTWAGAHVVLDIAAAADDSRAVRDLAGAHSFGFDYGLRHYMNYGCPMHSGTAYSYGNTMRGIYQFAEQIALVFPSYPSMDLTGDWVNQCSISKMYFWYPDKWYSGNNGILQGSRYGAETDNNTSSYSGRYLTITGITLDPVFNFSPLSANAQYFRNFLETVQTGSLWGYQGVTDDYQYANVLHSDPRIISSDYKVQPLQYVFKRSSSTTCATLTGWPCPKNFRGDSAVSRGPWTSLNSTFMYFGARTFWGDHDTQENGTVRITATGELVMTDFYPLGGQAATGNPDETTMGDILQFGGSKSLLNGIFTQSSAISGTATAAMTPITRWASSNHGSFDSAYGDQNSKSAYVCSELSPAYLTPMLHALTCVGHFKETGKDEFIVHHPDVDVTGNSTPIAIHIHFTQNGDAGNALAQPEGDTTCPGAGGCPSLDTNREIRSLQDGGSNGVTTRNHGVITHFLSPGTITLQDDSATSTITVTSVRKTATFTISSYITGVGFITTINTSTAHNLINGEVVMFNGVAGTGCGASNAFNNGVFTWPITVTGDSQFTIPFDTHTICPSPSSGTVTSITMFNAPAHGLVNPNPCCASVRVAGATGQWAVWNQHGMAIVVVDVDHFNEYWLSSPDTSAYTTSFDGAVQKFYPGGFGWTHRVTVAGGSSVGASVSTFKALIVHKIANGLSDTVLTTTAINPDSNWTGVQMCGSVSCSVYMGASNGVCHSTLSDFTTTHAGSGQYMIGGLCAGTWAITIGGSAVTGSPFTVSEGDNSVEFDSTAGVVHSTGSSLTATALALSSSAMPFVCTSGAVAGSYPLNIGATGLTLDNWSGSSNQTWATLSVTGGSSIGNTQVQVDCTSLSAGTYTATISIASTTSGVTNSPQTVALSLTVTGAGVPTLTSTPTSLSYSCVAGSGIQPTKSVAISALNTTLTNWSATKSQAWFSISPTSDTGPSSITGTADCTGLTVGTYTDSLMVASTTSGITNSPITVPITLVVGSAGATLSATPSTLAFTCHTGATNPGSQISAIAASGTTLTNWSVAATQPWLFLSPSTNTSASNLTVSVDCTGLSSGIKTDTILVTSTTPGIINSPVSIGIQLFVNPSSMQGTSTLKGKSVIH